MALLQPPDFRQLLVRQHLGHHTIHTYGPPDRVCGALLIARQHDNLEAHRLEPGDRRMTGGPDRVRHRNHAGAPAVHRHQGDRRTALRKAIRCGRKAGGVDAEPVEQPVIAHRDDVTLHPSGHALSGLHLEGLCGR